MLPEMDRRPDAGRVPDRPGIRERLTGGQPDPWLWGNRQEISDDFDTRIGLAPTLGLLLLVTAAALVGCGPPTQHDIVKKAEGIETKLALEETLGAPDEIDKLGPIEKWTYRASDGEMEFVITGDRIALEITDDLEDEAP